MHFNVKCFLPSTFLSLSFPKAWTLCSNRMHGANVLADNERIKAIRNYYKQSVFINSNSFSSYIFSFSFFFFFKLRSQWENSTTTLKFITKGLTFMYPLCQIQILPALKTFLILASIEPDDSPYKLWQLTWNECSQT